MIRETDGPGEAAPDRAAQRLLLRGRAGLPRGARGAGSRTRRTGSPTCRRCRAPTDPRNAGWTGRTGRAEQVITDMCKELGLRPDKTVVYICGNPEMILNVERDADGPRLPGVPRQEGALLAEGQAREPRTAVRGRPQHHARLNGSGWSPLAVLRAASRACASRRRRPAWSASSTTRGRPRRPDRLARVQDRGCTRATRPQVVTACSSARADPRASCRPARRRSCEHGRDFRWRDRHQVVRARRRRMAARPRPHPRRRAITLRVGRVARGLDAWSSTATTARADPRAAIRHRLLPGTGRTSTGAASTSNYELAPLRQTAAAGPGDGRDRGGHPTRCCRICHRPTH